jgi:Spy/CpxP family protein refolding chaperone
MKKNLTKFVGGLALLGTAFTVQAQTNLLFNANGETGDMTGWNVEQNGGDGWHVGPGYVGEHFCDLL